MLLAHRGASAPLIALFACLLAVGVVPVDPLSAQSVATHKAEDGTYVTAGRVMIDRPIEVVRQVLRNRPAYSEWLLRGVDGSDPRSAEFIGVLRRIEYNEERRRFVLYYDVNLPWPFGSKDNTVDFIYAEGRSRAGTPMFSVGLARPDGALQGARLDYRLHNLHGQTAVDFTAGIKFSWLIDLFLTLPVYSRNIEWRIQRVLRNLVERSETVHDSGNNS